ncbi:MAG: flavin monoamine oxidase family protein [bacterium]
MLRFPRTSQSRPLSDAERLQRKKDLRFQSPKCRALVKEISRVAVVGGGLAGLMAARELSQSGVKVTVFEAHHQVGGRVRSNPTFSRGRITEEGAELIGSFHTKWLGLAREYGLAMVSRMDPDLYHRAGLDVKLTLDKPLSMAEFLKLAKAMEERVLVPLAKLAKSIGDPSQPWKQKLLIKNWLMTKLDNMSVQDALPTFCKIAKRTKGNKDERLWKMIEFKLVNDEVAPLDEMNFLGLLCKVRGGQGERFGEGLKPDLMGYWDELEIFRCADGCQQLAKKMEEEINKKKGCKIVRDTMVTAVDILKDEVELALAPVSNKKRAHGAEQLERFEFVILATPPSVWAGVNIKVRGEKADPTDKIGKMHMNGAVKFFSDVKERFWINEKEKAAPYGGSLTLGQVWEGTDNQTRVILEIRRHHDVKQGVMVRTVIKQGIVLSVFAGPILPGRNVPTPGDFEKELEVLYPGYTNNLTKLLFSNWPHEPFIMTGYWAPKTGEIFKVGEFLSKPFHDRLFFAGEHTQMDFFGYMEGALRSGERAAQTLMLKKCGLLEELAPKPLSRPPQTPAPKKSSSPPLVARAMPTRETTASEREVGTRLEEHSSTDYSGEAESPFLHQELFVKRSEEEWEPRAAALVAESPFVGALEERRSRFDEDQSEEEEAADELEGEEELEAEEGWEELEEELLTPQADQEEEESLDDEGAPPREDETELESPEDLEELYGHEYELDQSEELAELKEPEGLESDEEELDWQMEGSGEEESEGDEGESVGPNA